jgi:hypothetical protein
MSSFAPLLAAGVNVDVIQLVVILVIIAISMIGRLLAKIQQAQRPPGGGPRPQQPPQPPANVTNEIDDFVRRAAQRRAAQGERPLRPRPAPQTAPSAQQPIRAEVVAAAPVGGQVTEHVKKYLDADEFSRRSAELGGEIVQSDRQIDQHLHQVFDHDLSRLATVPGETAIAPAAVEPSELSEAPVAEIPPTFAAGLAALLASADSIRQAIMFSEIIRRPEERWQ